jgi:hypothetical protein
VLLAFPTNDGLTAVAVQGAIANFPAFRRDVDDNFFAALALAPNLNERVRAGRRVERWLGTAIIEEHFVVGTTITYRFSHAFFRQTLYEEIVAPAFGTFAAIVEGRDRLEHEQWRNVWPNIREFTFRLVKLQALGTESFICVIVPWDSIGHWADGVSFSRRGRATLVLSRRDNRWVAADSHFSLAPSPG